MRTLSSNMLPNRTSEGLEERREIETYATATGASRSGDKSKTIQVKKVSAQNTRANKSNSASVEGALFHRKQQSQPLLASSYHPYQSHHGGTRLDLNIAAKDNLSSFTQRVMSAKLLRLKQLQNQLAEAHLQLNELCTENRLLRALQKRQDLALNRYEGSQAQLPQLVQSHHEEVRVLRAKYRTLKYQYRDTTKALKERETELQNLKEQHAHLLKLSRDRNLGEREALTKQVITLQSNVDEQANTIQMLNRKVMLETKNLKYQLQQEMQRHKATQSELREAFLKMEQLTLQYETKERNIIPVAPKRLTRSSVNPNRLHELRKADGTATSFQDVDEGHRNSQQISFEGKQRQRGPFQPSGPPHTDPSSDQPDSSVATYSDMTKSFTTSLDSTPEHIKEGNSGMSYSLCDQHLPSSNRDVHSLVYSDDQTVSIFNLLPHNNSKDDGKSSQNMESTVSGYENVLGVISEHSPGRGANDEDIAGSLASVDVALETRVGSLPSAVLAVNDVFPTKPASQSILSVSNREPQTQVSKLSLPHSEENATNDGPNSETSADLVQKRFSPSKLKNMDVKSSEEKIVTVRKMLPSGSGDTSFIGPKTGTGHSFLSKTENNNNPSSSFSSLNQSWGKLRQKLEAEEQSLSQNYTNTFNAELGDFTAKNNFHQENETFQKEALLKALKAIDDDAAELDDNGNESDESLSERVKVPRAQIPDKIFIAAEKSKVDFKPSYSLPVKRKPFK